MTDRDSQFPIGGPGGFPDELSVSPADDRYVLRLDDVSEADRDRIAEAGLEVVHELDHVGLVVVRGDRSAVEATGYEFVTDLSLER